MKESYGANPLGVREGISGRISGVSLDKSVIEFSSARKSEGISGATFVEIPRQALEEF